MCLTLDDVRLRNGSLLGTAVGERERGKGRFWPKAAEGRNRGKEILAVSLLLGEQY